MANFKPRVPAPKLYEFVPLADAVFDVPWARWVNQDHPVSDGWCGELVVTATTHTPILVSHDQAGSFFRAGGTCALSSTSVRGMLRSVLEIATFARVTQFRPKPDPTHKRPNPLDLAPHLPLCHQIAPAEGVADFVETLLGYVDKRESPRAPARRGRVAIKDFLLAPPKTAELTSQMRDLFAPRPDEAHARYVDFAGAVARGYKRYAATKTVHGAQSGRPFGTLPAASSFEGRIVVHNVRPVELGGLLWALTWGGDANARHTLGRAKPYGFGALTISVDWERAVLHPNDANAPERALDAVQRAQSWQQLFVDEMNRFTQAQFNRAWRGTEQMKALMALVVPR